MQRRHEGQPKHVKQGSLSSSSSNSTVSSIASKYDVNQLKKEITQAKSRVRNYYRHFEGKVRPPPDIGWGVQQGKSQEHDAGTNTLLY